MHGRSFTGKPHPKHLSVSKNRYFIRLLYMYHFVYVTVNKCVHFCSYIIIFARVMSSFKNPEHVPNCSMNKMKFPLRKTNYLREFANEANEMH